MRDRLIFKQTPKSAAGRHISNLPSWAVIMLQGRQAEDGGENELAHRDFPAPARRDPPVCAPNREVEDRRVALCAAELFGEHECHAPAA
jgi:hypothetical protein